ncbi:hypothetical protein [Guptibacillus hwajinpoensis]|uniref:hypothetical protein n=1 Tax=Guptibacillus hwajinpoensis TaxID=208199 RepID=UPI0018836ECB|nr:hypothetical protein [Pseudalkalibacillus hwajinpoensis]MBF0708619.1 hypothetical protein [Pseudalkalibacillus hwajinpoensis]WLR59916.1 hypothetical protein LC071_00455 [Pseudalkalibacillus hwajinpoensis]
MELVQCIRDVFEEEPLTGSESVLNRKLFKEGHFYPVYKDEHHSWITLDDEGEQHIIATGISLNEDFWFTFRFRIA